jgi:uncharacterized protein (TIGR02996 family)
MADGDEAQERYCYDCRHMEDRLRSQGGVSWYVEDSPHRMHSAQGIEATLLAQIRAAPDDDAPRSIYADWLIERGDPLGTFIALQLARAQKRDPAVSAEEQKLLDENWRAWLGPASRLFAPQDIQFERGFWSWARSTRGQFDFIARQAPPLMLDELVLMFDVSNDPPDIAAPGLRYVRRLCVPSLPELTARWIERADAAKIRHLTLWGHGNDADIREAIDHARSSRIDHLTLVVDKSIGMRIVREADGSYLIRAVTLQHPWFAQVKRWFDLLGDYIDPGVKIEMDEVVPEQAEAADRLGLKLVRRAPECRASPK